MAFMNAERSGSTLRARLVGLRLERDLVKDGFDPSPDAFRFRGGGPDPRLGVATPVVLRRIA